MITKSAQNPTITKIIPGLRASYEIVSLPQSAWNWLEDYMHFFEMRDYPELLNDFTECIACHDNLGEVLHNIAAVHAHFVTQLAHNLENDNDPYDEILPVMPGRQSAEQTHSERPYANAMTLFGFMPRATSFEAVMRRQQKRGI